MCLSIYFPAGLMLKGNYAVDDVGERDGHLEILGGAMCRQFEDCDFRGVEDGTRAAGALHDDGGRLRR
jgi:hypothetical protein